jgi:hypothetical protein
MEKKPWDVAKVQCFSYDKLGHFAKDCEKGKARLGVRGFVAKANMAKLGLNLILLRFN